MLNINKAIMPKKVLISWPLVNMTLKIFLTGHSGKNYIKTSWTAFWKYLKRSERDCIRAATAFDNT